MPFLCRFTTQLLAVTFVAGWGTRTASGLDIRAIDGMQFDVVRSAVKPGQKLTIFFGNADATDQPHNFVIGKPGKLKELIDAALALGVDGPAQDYIPRSSGLVLAATRLLKAGEREELIWNAPDEPGVYPYTCTFPGHGLLMFGAFYVGVPMPALKDDPHVPKSATTAREFPLITRPCVQRIFMPNSGPASIAIALPHGQNACWDAGSCRLRYFWSGGFISTEKHFTSKGTGTAELLGNVWWHTPPGFPVRREGDVRGESERPLPKFKGYKLENGLPIFSYHCDGIDVIESIHSGPDGSIHRRFRIRVFPAEKLCIVVGLHGPQTSMTANQGTISLGRVDLTAEEAKDVTITYRPLTETN